MSRLVVLGLAYIALRGLTRRRSLDEHIDSALRLANGNDRSNVRLLRPREGQR